MQPGRTITVSAYNRPDYLETTLQNLAQCKGVERYEIMVIIDSSEFTEQTKDVCERYDFDWIANATRLGCAGNIQKCLDIGFAKSDFHIHLEDDTPPSVDCLAWFDWAQRHAPVNCLTVSAYNQKGAGHAEDGAGVRKHFTPWGWGTWRFNYKTHLRPFWRDYGWDNGVQFQRHRLGMQEIYPLVSRTSNIGATRGTFCPGPEFHELNQKPNAVSLGLTSQWVLTEGV